MNKKLQLNSKFEFNNNFFFISPLLHEYSFFDPRWGPGSLEGANTAKAAAQRDVGKDRKDLGGKNFLKKKKSKKKSDTFSICACHPCAGAMLIFSVSFQF